MERKKLSHSFDFELYSSKNNNFEICIEIIRKNLNFFRKIFHKIEKH
jgi:hypothetical protein